MIYLILTLKMLIKTHQPPNKSSVRNFIHKYYEKVILSCLCDRKKIFHLLPQIFIEMTDIWGDKGTYFYEQNKNTERERETRMGKQKWSTKLCDHDLNVNFDLNNHIDYVLRYRIIESIILFNVTFYCLHCGSSKCHKKLFMK